MGCVCALSQQIIQPLRICFELRETGPSLFQQSKDHAPSDWKDLLKVNGRLTKGPKSVMPYQMISKFTMMKNLVFNVISSSPIAIRGTQQPTRDEVNSCLL